MKLNALGFEVRPIVAGNFAKNEVVKYFNSEVSGDLTNAEHIDGNGLFVGNHHYSIQDAIKSLKNI
jgi:CDP-6-deoxy-D-xylo-4-hexulose-3-dehydrase